MPEEINQLEPFTSRHIVCELPEYNIQLKFLFLQLNSSIFIWIGDEEGKLSGLSVCLPSKVSGSIQHSTTIYSVDNNNSNNGQTGCNSFSEYEETLSCKISKRLNCPVFVSISLSSSEFIALWNNVHFTTGSTFGQTVEYHLFKNLSSFVQSK